jgi:hypothetical protein
MRFDRLFRVRLALFFVLSWLAAGHADGQSKSAAPEITVYESPT